MYGYIAITFEHEPILERTGTHASVTSFFQPRTTKKASLIKIELTSFSNSFKSFRTVRHYIIGLTHERLMNFGQFV